MNLQILVSAAIGSMQGAPTLCRSQAHRPGGSRAHMLHPLLLWPRWHHTVPQMHTQSYSTESHMPLTHTPQQAHSEAPIQAACIGHLLCTGCAQDTADPVASRSLGPCLVELTVPWGRHLIDLRNGGRGAVSHRKGGPPCQVTSDQETESRAASTGYLQGAWGH